MIKTANLLRIAAVTIALLSILAANELLGTAQQPSGWAPQQTIPDYHPDTETPYLLADQNGIVHAFSSQWLGEEEGQSVKAIIYNQWSLEQGWTAPVDIMLSPIKEARIMGAFLDQSGILHIIFYGGDATAGDIYYARALAARAGQVRAWSAPVLVAESANDPSVAALAGDDEGNLVIVYSGKQDGWGLYSLYSADGGEIWTDPTPTFLTYGALFPFVLKLYLGPSGVVHAVWDVRDLGGNGRRINYAGLDLTDQVWTEPVILAEAEIGYGVLNPTVVEHDGEIIVAYSGVTVRSSKDGGQTWTAPVNPFRQAGVNGVMSFVVDSNEELHLLWAQRISGSPDIHGVWHSIGLDGYWTEPEAVVSGPQVRDDVGDRAFDPYDVRAVVSQGNVLLATWRTDPGAGRKANGVWYSYSALEAPSLSGKPLPTVAPTPIINPNPTATASSSGLASQSSPELSDRSPSPRTDPLLNDPASALLVGIASVIVLISVVVIRVVSANQKRN